MRTSWRAWQVYGLQDDRHICPTRHCLHATASLSSWHPRQCHAGVTLEHFCEVQLRLVSCLSKCRGVGQIVFPKAWWVGKREENPNEEQLPLPDSLLSRSSEPQAHLETGSVLGPCPCPILQKLHKHATVQLQKNIPQVLVCLPCSGSSSTGPSAR